MDILGDGLDDRLWLADWRRRVAELYVAVRHIATEDPVAAWDHWRRAREDLYRHHPASPVPVEDRASFVARHFPYDPALRFELEVAPAPQPASGALALELPNSGPETLSFSRLGTLGVPLPGGQQSLSLFWMAGYAGGVFLPFRDGTNGAETYGAGRYLLDTAKSADLGGDAVGRTRVVDFNFAFQPSCAFDSRWACPLAPPENRLAVAVRAGERLV